VLWSAVSGLDLSRPKGRSVNDGIEPEVCSLSYASVDQAVRIIMSKWRLTQMAKFDIESAYRLVPVHPDDRLLLGMKWREFLYVDTTLPFGLRSAPKIFNAVARVDDEETGYWELTALFG